MTLVHLRQNQMFVLGGAKKLKLIGRVWGSSLNKRKWMKQIRREQEAEELRYPVQQADSPGCRLLLHL